MRKALAERIDPAHLEAYHNRSLSTKELAKLYGLTSAYVVRTLPKRPIKNKKVDIFEGQRHLRALRKEFRDGLAAKVIDKQMTVEEAAKTAHCTVRNLYRHIKAVREARNA